MSDEKNIDGIVLEIAQSKGYKHLEKDTIKRVAIDLASKYDAKNLVKEVKNKLHQIWGAFYDGNPNFEKLLSKLKENIVKEQPVETILTQFTQLHSSTKERLEILPDLYTKIFEIAGKINSIVEYGCGLNSLSLILSGLKEKVRYIGYDIDAKEVDFLNDIFNSLEIYPRFETKYGDIFTQELPQGDIAFLLKLLPTIEQQQKGISLEILNKLPNKWIVVSFPVFSIGKKSKNMTEFYTKWFEELITKLEFKTSVVKLEFKTELVFVVNRT